MDKTRLLNVITNIVILIGSFKQLQNCNAALQKDECPYREAPSKTLGMFGGDQSDEKIYFCQKLGFIEVSSKFMNKNIDWLTCLVDMDDYFKIVLETEETIDTFVDCCNKLERLSFKCIEIIIELEGLCHNMTTATELLETIGKEPYIGIGEFNGIKLIQKYFGPEKEFTSFFQTSVCLKEFTGADYKHNFNILKIYMNWKNKLNSSNQRSYCTCLEVTGLAEISDARSKKDKTLSVDDYYQKICLKNNYNRDVWQKRHFLHIAKVAMDLDLDELKTFLLEADNLASACWGCEDLPNLSFSNWNFVDLKEAIELRPDSVSPTSVDLIGRAMMSGFTYKDYDDFIKVTSTFEGFEEYDCRRDIFITAFKFSLRDVSIPSTTRFERNEEFWVNSPKTIFNIHLRSLLEMFHRKINEVKTCNKFIKILKKLKEELRKTAWNVNEITEIITKSNAQKKSLLVMIHCIKFSFDLETKISQLNLLKQLCKDKEMSYRRRVTDDYSSQFAMFRAILFGKGVQELKDICENGFKYIENEKSILNLMNTTLGGTEDNLQNLFDKFRETATEDNNNLIAILE